MTTATASLRSRTASFASQDMLAALLLTGGALNGFCVRAIEAWSDHGPEAVLLGISPFELITLAIAAWLGVEDRAARRPARIGWAETLAMAVLLVPSSAVSWLIVLAYGALRAGQTIGRRRAGALLFVGLAAGSLWSSVAVKWLALPLTSAEASLAAWLLSLMRGDLVLAGNVIGVADGHTLIVMTACSTFHGLPKALLALIAISLACGVATPPRLARDAAVLCLAYGLANVVRLGLMAWSKPMFELVHGPVGANLFDGMQTLLIFLLVLGSGRR